MNLYRTIHGSAHDIPLPDGSVQMIVLIDTNSIFLFAFEIKGFASPNMSIGMATTRHVPNLPPSIFAPNRDDNCIRSVFQFSKLQDSFGDGMFNFQIWQEFRQDNGSFFVGCLVTIKRPSLGNTWRFLIVTPAKSVSQKLDCILINHSNLDTFLICGIDTSIVFGIDLLDTNIGFSIQQSGNIGKLDICSHFLFVSIMALHVIVWRRQYNTERR